jgi:hypothetical protein
MDDLTPTPPFRPPSGRSTGDLLAQARSRGRSIRYRHRALLGSGALVLVALIAIPVASAALSGRSPHTLRVATNPDDTTTTTDATTSTTDATTATTAAPAAAGPTTTTTARATTTTALVCRNSDNPACGTFRWDPAPAPADPASITITFSPSNPKAGDTVTFTVHHHNPNTYISACGKETYGDIESDCIPDYPACAQRYGPWDPPAKKPDDSTNTITHAYKNPGTYTVRIQYPAGSNCYDPYQGTVTGSVTVTVN